MVISIWSKSDVTGDDCTVVELSWSISTGCGSRQTAQGGMMIVLVVTLVISKLAIPLFFYRFCISPGSIS